MERLGPLWTSLGTHALHEVKRVGRRAGMKADLLKRKSR